MWKNGIVMMVVLVGVLMAGCELPEEKGHYQKLTEVVIKVGEKQEETTKDIIAAIKEGGVVDEEKIGKVEEAVEKIGEKFDEWKEPALASAKKYDELREENKTLAIIEAAREGNRLIPTQYAPLIEAGLGLAAIIAGGYGWKKRKEAVEANEEAAVTGNAVAEIVKGIEVFKTAATGDEAKVLKTKLSESTSADTKVLIAENRY